MILDEGKIVTYLTLSKDLCIHINNSKLLMDNFIKIIREEQPKQGLNINYMLSGLIDENKIKVTVCPENKLEEQKKSFKVVYFVHIYSISKGSPKENSAAFVSLTKYDDYALCPGIIKSSISIKRSNEEIGNLKSNSRKKIVEVKLDLQQKKSKQEVKTKPSNNNNGLVKGKADVKSETPMVKETKKEIISHQQEQKSKQNNKPTQKGIAGFFSKQNGIEKKKENKMVEDLKPTIPNVEQDILVETMDLENQEVINETQNEDKNDNKYLNHIKKNSKVDKKRKRVLHVSDSDSEEENDPFIAEENKAIDPEFDDEIPPTPATNNLKITSGIVNPRKKRKAVDKTYMSDDGYVITKKEEVYESCSDTENIEHEVKKEIKEEKLKVSSKSKTVKNSPKKKKVSPPQKGKQATLMSFFTKK